MAEETVGNSRSHRRPVFKSVRRSLHLLSVEDRRSFLIVVLLQVVTALLDVVAIVVVGVVAITFANDGVLPTWAGSLLEETSLSKLDSSEVLPLLGVFAALLLALKSLVYGLLLHRIYKTLGEAQARVAIDLTHRYVNSPNKLLDEESTQQDVAAIVTGTGPAVSVILGGAAVLVAEGVLLLSILVILVVISPGVTFAALVFFAVVGYVTQRWIGPWATRNGVARTRGEVTAFRLLQEATHSHREMSVLARRDWFVRRAEASLVESARAASLAQFIFQIPKMVYESAMVVGAILLVVWQFSTLSTAEAFSVIAVFLVAASRALPSLLRLNGMMVLIRQSSGEAWHTYELAERLPSRAAFRQAAPKVAQRPFTASVELNGACFQYPSGSGFRLQDISFRLEPGTSLAVVGPSGCGKTTLVDLILGLLEPDSGSVLVSGIPAPLVALEWPGSVAYVPQQVFLHQGTVRSNVLFGLSPEVAPDSEVWSALERVQLKRVMEAAPEQLDTQVGEHGMRLSGGQRQRLGIARALLAAPSLLVLDEATSALDPETESLVAATVSDLGGSTTVITIAHRMSTVLACDQVLVLESGRVVGLGDLRSVVRDNPWLRAQMSTSSIEIP